MGVRKHADGISFDFHDIFKHEDLALEVIKRCIKKWGKKPFSELEHEVWDKFIVLIQQKWPWELPPPKDWLLALGYKTYAEKILETNRERRNWQYKLWGTVDSPADMLATVLQEKFPELIQDLDKAVSPYFIEYKEFKEKKTQEIAQNTKAIAEEVKQAMIIETGEKKLFFSKYGAEFNARVIAEYEKRFPDHKRRAEGATQLCYNIYRSKIEDWFCEKHLCDEKGNPPKSIVEKVVKWIGQSYFQEFYNENTKTKGWCSKFGTHSLKEFLDISTKNAHSPFYAYPRANTPTFSYFQREDFEFRFPGWLPNVHPRLSEQNYKKELKAAFENQLKDYLTEVRNKQEHHKLNTNSTPEKVELHIEWLIHHLVFNKTHKTIGIIYGKSQSTVTDGINYVAGLLNIKGK